LRGKRIKQGGKRNRREAKKQKGGRKKLVICDRRKPSEKERALFKKEGKGNKELEVSKRE